MAYLMIIDDDEDFSAAVSKVLRDAGHEVQAETEITSAVRSMHARRPDLVILDVMFPEDGSAGFQLARDMRRKFEGLGKVPILMLTAVNTKSPFGFSAKDIDEDWLPVTDFLEKPVDMDVLADRVSALLASSAGQRP